MTGGSAADCRMCVGFYDIVTCVPETERSKNAKGLKERYADYVSRRDGDGYLPRLYDFFRENERQDPESLPMMMEKYALGGVVSDLDGTLINGRTGYGNDRLFSPGLGNSIGKVINTYGTFTIVTASHYKRMIYLIEKAKNTCGQDRVLLRERLYGHDAFHGACQLQGI